MNSVLIIDLIGEICGERSYFSDDTFLQKIPNHLSHRHISGPDGLRYGYSLQFRHHQYSLGLLYICREGLLTQDRLLILEAEQHVLIMF